MAGKTKILMTADTIGGVWTYSLELAKALKKYEIEIELATMGKLPDEDQIKEANALGNINLHTSQFALEWMEYPWSDVDAAGKWLLELEEKTRPDIIHLNNYCHGSLNWKSPVIVVGHSCVLTWWQNVKGTAAPGDWNEYKSRVKEGISSANIFIAPSKSIMKQYENAYGSIKNKLIIYNGRNPADFESGEKEKIVFSMGRLWDEAKNITTLLKAAREIPFPVYIAGEASGNKFLSISSNVHFLGNISQREVSKWLKKAALYALPVKYEPFGLSMLEAALSGCALVLGNTDTMRELWKGAASLVYPDNQFELAYRCNELLTDENKRKIFAKRARDRALTYSADTMAENYFNVYKTFLPVEEEVNQLKTILGL